MAPEQKNWETNTDLCQWTVDAEAVVYREVQVTDLVQLRRRARRHVVRMDREMGIAIETELRHSWQAPQ